MAFHTESGRYCQHEKEAIPAIKSIISSFDPELVIELGTKLAGFTEIIQCSTRVDTPIFSYDSEEYPIGLREAFRENVKFIISDIISQPLDNIIRICKSNNRKLLYCDNGSKITEVNYYAIHLNHGDMLGVHDWGTEITYEHVASVLSKFKPVSHKIFEENGWKTRFWIKGQT